ncbi:hypothetical protein CU098_011837 [Rhizopus stolonifer]|uniref:sphingomyelin phosphodiesterase n=1 Tax=Rhizopus stolonifer TaxID=4846 RepID=A0A367KWK8_RHIST|nr:hypothetical protein CU098_011837 [Rhizopus stolonifer]
MDSLLKDKAEENTENGHYENIAFIQPQHARDRRHNQQELAPLLVQSSRNSSTEFLVQDEEGDLEEEELVSPPIVSEKHRRFTQCCSGARYYRKKTCLVACLLATLLPIIAFVIFSAIYFSPVSLPSIPETSQLLSAATSIRLLTLNIFMRPPGIKNNKSDYKNDRLEYIIQHILPSYDIVTIQEAFAFANRRIDHLLAAAFDQGFYYHVSSPRHYPWELAGDGGLLILSRFPIKKSNRIEFSRGVHSDWLSYKGALHALIELNSTYIHVYTTHTQASYDNGGELNLDDTKVRLSQFADVHEFIADTAKDDTHPILLMGDLNVDAAVHNGSPIDTPSYSSSLPYTMMMDVLRGRGTDFNLINKDPSNRTQIQYASTWRLDNLTDMAYKTFGYHPVTFGDYHRLENGTLVPAETTLTSHNQLLTVQSIDRILWTGNRGHTNMSLGNVTIIMV